MADSVWLLVMFDIPVKTREQRRLATGYRHLLLDLGFNQIQFSVYAKYVVNATGIRSILPPIRDTVPPNGAVRMIKLTDEQWSSTYRYYGPKQLNPEPRPTQLGLFSDLLDSQENQAVEPVKISQSAFWEQKQPPNPPF